MEENYNAVHKTTRSTIERCNGTLKMRFRCLLKHRVLHYAPNKASKIVKACVVLHNMCVRNGIELLNEDNVDMEDLGAINMDNAEEEIAGIARVNPELNAGRQFRRRIALQLMN